MNTTLSTGTGQQLSSIRIDIRIDEAWIRKMIKKQDLTFSIKDRQFNQVSISLNEGQLTFGARVVDKKEAIVGITARPRWDAELQQFFLEDVLIQTKTTNLVLKSMGWIASNFMQEKIDDKIESYVRELHKQYLEAILTKPVNVPIKDHGMASATVKSVTIHSVQFIEKAILVNVTIEGLLNVQLQY